MTMKQYIFTLLVSFGTLFITSCGDNNSAPNVGASIASPTATPLSVPPSPSPQVAFVGNWVNLSGNTLDFNGDGSAISDGNSLQWSVDPNGSIVFTAQSVQIDVCSYNILTAGGLTSSLVVTLDLGCNKAGQLTYTEAP